MNIIKQYVVLIAIIIVNTPLTLRVQEHMSEEVIAVNSLEIDNEPVLVEPEVDQEEVLDFEYKSASVLPFYTSRREKYLILSREAYGKSKRWTYDDFGGSRDKGENDSLLTAAREFFEEGIIDKCLNITLDDLYNYIKNHTEFIVAKTKPDNAGTVTYIVNFKQYKNQFINNFYSARRRATTRETKEKDRIAIVKWNDLKQAIINRKDDNESVYVKARVIDKRTLKKYTKNIKLRAYFVIKLKGFFLDQPYKTKRNEKMRVYS